MFRKYSILAGISSSLILLLVATLYYPGGSQYDRNATGYDWKHNYLSNLFSSQAVNGLNNAAQYWAIAGMLLLCVSFALFFIYFSKKISDKRASKIIRYCGTGAMLFAFLAVTPYHDSMITIASTLSLLSIFYVTVFIFKSKLHLLKILSVLTLVILYICNYVYYTQNFLEILAILQKIMLAVAIIFVLTLHYFTRYTDFQPKNT